jgi:hypothetical protein
MEDLGFGFRSSPPPFLVLDHHEVVCSRFFFDYVLPVGDDNPYKGVMDYLPQLYKESGPNSALHVVVTACSYASFHRRFWNLSGGNQIEGAKAYGQALALVQDATHNEATAKSDQLLLAVYLLGLYDAQEVCVLFLPKNIHQSVHGGCHQALPQSGAIEKLKQCCP